MRARVKAMFTEPEASRLIEVYGRANPGATPSDLFLLIYSDRLARRNSVRLSERKAAQGKVPVHMYLFAWKSPALGGKLRSPHTVEIPFVFDNTDVPTVMTRAPGARELAARVSSAWIAFARTAIRTRRSCRSGRGTTPRGAPRWCSTTRAASSMIRAERSGEPGGLRTWGTRRAAAALAALLGAAADDRWQPARPSGADQRRHSRARRAIHRHGRHGNGRRFCSCRPTPHRRRRRPASSPCTATSTRAKRRRISRSSSRVAAMWCLRWIRPAMAAVIRPAFRNGFGGPDGLRYLRSLDIVDKDNIGLEGHSMGGWTVVNAAAALPDGIPVDRARRIEHGPTVFARGHAGVPAQPRRGVRAAR